MNSVMAGGGGAQPSAYRREEMLAPGVSFAGLLRWTSITGVVASALLIDMGLGVLIAAVASLLAVDILRPLALANIALAYNFLLLEVGSTVITVAGAPTVQSFGASLAVASLVGAVAGRQRSARGRRRVADGQVFGQQAFARSVRLLKVTIWFGLAVNVLQVAQIGLSEYLSGAGLAADIQTYASKGLSGQQIVSLATGVLGMIVIALHVSITVQTAGAKLAWRPMLLLGIGLPIIGLSRSEILFSAIALLLVRTFTRGKPVARDSVASRLLLALMTFALVFGLGVGIGTLREQALTAGGGATSIVLKSEFSPVEVVDFALGSSAPPRFHGSTLFIPALARFIPRRLFPAKPDNTAVRFTKITAPNSYAAGYNIAPTAVGVLLLNFGVIITLLAWSTVMFIIVRVVDRPSTISGYGVGVLVMVYASAYPLLRDDLANSVPQLLIALLIYSVLRYQVIGRNPRA